MEVPEALRGELEAAFRRVWTGPLELLGLDQLEGSPTVLAVIAGDDPDPEALWSLARQIEERLGGVPVVALFPGASRLRARRAVPPQVTWAASTKDLAPRVLELIVRYALERADRRNLEHRLQEGRFEDLGWLNGTVSHEIGNSLTSLLTNLELLQSHLAAVAVGRETLDAEMLREGVRDAYAGAHHVGRIADDLGRVSRRGRRSSVVEVATVVSTARRLASRALEGVEVRLLLRACPQARVDETRLCQVFINLLKNAARALESVEEPQINLSVDQEDDQVVLCIKDNGPGIDWDSLESLFQPWFTTRRDGSGVGLALSRQYIEQMGGTLELKDHQDGATFEIRLPVADVVPSRPTLVPDRAAVSARILVVDDTKLVRTAIARTLRRDHEVRLCADVDAALEAVAEQRYDLAFVDLRMPNRGGIDFYEALEQIPREQHPRVVFLSGAFSDGDLAYLETHNLRWVRKPVGSEVLRNLVSEIMSPR